MIPLPSSNRQLDRRGVQGSERPDRDNAATARRLFGAAAAAAPFNPYIAVAWARAEAASGDVGAARAVLAAGARRSPGSRGGALLREWASLEAAAGDAVAARRLFATGRRSGDAMLLTAWAEFEEREGDADRAAVVRQWADEAATAEAARRGRGATA